MINGANPGQKKRKGWTNQELAEKIGAGQTKNGKLLKPNTVGYWRNGKSLPRDVEPLIKIFFGSESEADVLRSAHRQARAEQDRIRLKRAQDPAAPSWVERVPVEAIEREVRPSDERAAKDPRRRQLQAVILAHARTLAGLLQGRPSRYGNNQTWKALPPAAEAFAEIAALEPEALIERLTEAYTTMLQLGRLLETDRLARVDRDPVDPPLELDIQGALTDLVRAAAAWMRGFPTVARMDDDAGRLLTRPGSIEPALLFIKTAHAHAVIDDRDAAEMEALANAADVRTFPGEKAARRAVGGASNLVWALAEVLAARQAGAIDRDDAPRRSLARRAGETLAEAKGPVEALIETAPEDLRGALRALLAEAGRRDRDDDAPPPPPDVEARAREMILKGIAPPKAWRPFIRTLDFQGTELADAAPLAGLTALTSLDLSRTQIADAAPLAGLTGLTSLDLSHTKIVDASPLAGLTGLTRLNHRNTPIADAAPLSGLTALTSLDLSFTEVADAAHLARLTRLTSLDLSQTKVADAAPLAGLTDLTSLNLSGTEVADAAPLAGLTRLTSLDLSQTKVADAAPLAGLTALTTLDLWDSAIANAAPLAGLTALTLLDLGSTKIADAAPLAGLTALTSLGLGGTQVADAAPLAGLTGLTELRLVGALITDAAPLAALTGLTTLDLDHTPIADAAPLAGLTGLTFLFLKNTPIADAAPLAGLTKLEILDLRGTRVTDLSPLAALIAAGLKIKSDVGPPAPPAPRPR